MNKRSFILAHAEARRRAHAAIDDAPDGYAVSVSEPNRTLEQNSLQWPILEAFSHALQWPINGKMEWLCPEEWKDILTAAFRKETVRVAMGLDGGVVMLGSRTSKFSKAEFSNWIEFLMATAALRGVAVDYRA